VRGNHAAGGGGASAEWSSLETIYFVLFDEQATGFFERTWKGLQA